MKRVLVADGVLSLVAALGLAMAVVATRYQCGEPERALSADGPPSGSAASSKTSGAPEGAATAS